MKPPYHNEGPKEEEKWNQMGVWQFWKLEGQIITKTSRGKGKGDILGAAKRTPKKREREKFGFTNRIFFQIPQPCLVGQTNLFSFIQND
jgi:hypothetical protein